jgi:hypothetical protein
MKTIYFLTITLIAAFSFGGCRTQNDVDYKITFTPGTTYSVTSSDDLNKAAGVINKRLIYFFNIPQERIKTDITEDIISLTISKIDTGKVDLIREMITDYARLEFRETYENSEIIGFLSKANSILKDFADTTGITGEAFKNQNPLFAVLSPMVSASGEPLPSCMIGLAAEKDTSEINRYLKLDQIRALFPPDLKFYWSANRYKYSPAKELYGLHATKVTTINGKAPLDGSAIISAKTTSESGNSGVKIELTMDRDGTRIWAKMTRENINRCIAVIYDGYIRSYPRVIDEISGGITEISGDFTSGEANDLVNTLKSGQLPFELRILEEKIINRE